MTFQDYFSTTRQSKVRTTSYEEQLLLNYEDAMEGKFASSLTDNSRYSLEFGELEDNLEDDFESEYDENDWEEEDSENDNKEEPGTFLMRS